MQGDLCLRVKSRQLDTFTIAGIAQGDLAGHGGGYSAAGHRLEQHGEQGVFSINVFCLLTRYHVTDDSIVSPLNVAYLNTKLYTMHCYSLWLQARVASKGAISVLLKRFIRHSTRDSEVHIG